MLCNGSARPGPPGQLGSGLQALRPKGLTPSPLSLCGQKLLGFRNAFAYQWYFNILIGKVNVFSKIGAKEL
jgi:hypothetical protein